MKKKWITRVLILLIGFILGRIVTREDRKHMRWVTREFFDIATGDKFA